jgi:hypothetical protein
MRVQAGTLRQAGSEKAAWKRVHCGGEFAQRESGAGREEISVVRTERQEGKGKWPASH